MPYSEVADPPSVIPNSRYKKMRKRYKKYMKHHAPRIYTAHNRRTYQIVAPPPVRGHKHGWHKHHHDWDDD